MQYLEDILELIEDLPEEIARRFEKIRRLDAEINESMRAYKALRVRLLGQSVSQEEKQRLCSEAAQIFIKARRLGDQKLEIAERSQYLMSNVSDKVSESAYHCKIELEVDHCGITEVIERSFCSSRGLHPPDMKDCQVKFILDPMEQNEISSYVDAMLPAKPRAFKDDLLCPPARNKGVPVKRKREKTSRGRGRPPKHDPLALCSAYSEADDASSRASSTRDEDSIANLLNDFGSSVDDDLTDFADIFPQMPSPPREILDIIKDDSVSVFSLEQELSIGALGSPRAESPSRLNERKRKALFTGATEVSLHGRQRKLTTRVEEMISEKREKERRRANRDEESHSTLSDLKEEMEEEEDNYTVWCICKKPSAGEMICCDNEGKCRIQWFHFECLGLTEAPAGSWFCPECKARQQQTASTRA